MNLFEFYSWSLVAGNMVSSNYNIVLIPEQRRITDPEPHSCRLWESHEHGAFLELSHHTTGWSRRKIKVLAPR